MNGSEVNSKDFPSNRWLRGESVALMIVGSPVRTHLGTRFENLDFVRNLLFPLLRNSKSVVDDKRLANAIIYQK